MDLQILTQPELKPEAGCTLLQDGLHCTEDELLATMQQAMPAPATLVLWRRQDIVWGDMGRPVRHARRWQRHHAEARAGTPPL